jgi:hypothetical protein
MAAKQATKAAPAAEPVVEPPAVVPVADPAPAADRVKLEAVEPIRLNGHDIPVGERFMTEAGIADALIIHGAAKVV